MSSTNSRHTEPVFDRSRPRQRTFTPHPLFQCVSRVCLRMYRLKLHVPRALPLSKAWPQIPMRTRMPKCRRSRRSIHSLPRIKTFSLRLHFLPCLPPSIKHKNFHVSSLRRIRIRGLWVQPHPVLRDTLPRRIQSHYGKNCHRKCRNLQSRGHEMNLVQMILMKRVPWLGVFLGARSGHLAISSRRVRVARIKKMKMLHPLTDL